MNLNMIVVVFTILANTVIKNVSSASFQNKDSEETGIGDNLNESELEDEPTESEFHDDLAESEFDESFDENKDEGSDLEENYENTNKEYKYGLDLLYFGQEQSGYFNNQGAPVVRGEYFFVENGKEYKVSYVADEKGYRPKYTVMDTTKDSPPTYKGRTEYGEYTFTKYRKIYKIKYVVDEKGFRPIEVEVDILAPDREFNYERPSIPFPAPRDPLIVSAFLG